MAHFAYEGRREGAPVHGVLAARDPGDAARRLQRRGIEPLRLEATVAPEASALPRALAHRFRGRVRSEELVLFARQMRALCRSGVPMGRALRGLSDSARSPRLRGVLGALAGQIEAGASLSAAMRRHPAVFPELFVNLVQVGEGTGRLDHAFEQMVAWLELERDTRRRVAAATRYPAFVLVAMGTALVIVNLYVIPAFADVFDSYGAELPWQTRALLAVSGFFVDFWPFLLVGAAGSLVALRAATATAAGARARDAALLRAPLLGSLVLRILVARLCRTLAMVFRSGIPILQGLRIAAATLDNRALAERAAQLKAGIERGETLTRAARNARVFTPIALQMIAVGEETGQLDELLDQAATFYEEEIDYELKALSDAIEPILVVAIGALVLVLALGVFLPLWDLSGAATR